MVLHHPLKYPPSTKQNKKTNALTRNRSFNGDVNGCPHRKKKKLSPLHCQWHSIMLFNRIAAKEQWICKGGTKFFARCAPPASKGSCKHQILKLRNNSHFKYCVVLMASNCINIGISHHVTEKKDKLSGLPSVLIILATTVCMYTFILCLILSIQHPG